jgi:hypothetical protein
MRTLILVFATAAFAYAGMIGDTVSSILHTAFAGSWSGGTGPETAVVDSGIEFDRTFFGGPIDISLDIDATSFALKFTNTEPSGSFNLGLDGFEFSDLAQNFTGIVPVSNTFQAGSITSTSVTAHNIHIFMNEPIIPAGTTWTATWNVNFGAVAVPEPMTISMAGPALLLLAAGIRKMRRTQSQAS